MSIDNITTNGVKYGGDILFVAKEIHFEVDEKFYLEVKMQALRKGKFLKKYIVDLIVADLKKTEGEK